MPRLHLATFRVDATVPLGHPLCGGWIKPAEKITEPLLALGVVLLGPEAPIVLCAVDWTGICNEAHIAWRDALAKAAHTTPERIAVHCVHQHNAPFADLAAQKLVAGLKGVTDIVDVKWFNEVIERTADAVKAAMGKTQPVTHVGVGQARVEKVACNRRLVSPDGKLIGWRGSSCKDAKLREAPEGLIDPMLKTVSFWKEDTKLVSLHYYATHPMSYYGDGVVTSDFVGLARERRTADDKVPHIYFTGCAGNVAAGKYNDGAHETRQILADRIHAAMVESEKTMERRPVVDPEWRVRPVVLPPRADTTAEELLKVLLDASKQHAVRSRAAMKLSYRRRAEAKVPIQLSSLHFGEKVCLLHMPAESFVEFQLHAQELRRDAFVATAAYGDGGPWYIPIKKAFAEGGYEPSVAFAESDAEALLKSEIARLVARG